MSFTNAELRTAMGCLQRGAIHTLKLNVHGVDPGRLEGAYVALGGCPISRRAVADMLERGFSDNLDFTEDERAIIEAVLAELSL